VPRAILSIAGSANHQLRENFIDALRDIHLASRLAIVSDVLPILAAGTPACCGIALIAGTGSVAFARAADGPTALCGGWGYLLGDEGSGYAIGRAALQFALQQLESRAAPGPLAQAVLSAVGANSVLDVTKAIYRRADPRAAIASIAPVVTRAADENDPHAQELLDAAAADLAALVARASRAIGFTDEPFPLAVAGGIVVGSRRLQQQLQVELGRQGLAAEMRVVDEPLEGCVRLATADDCGSLLTWHKV
jgi:N-acetylglucosamine kinase-like BadF-type ATPase